MKINTKECDEAEAIRNRKWITGRLFLNVFGFVDFIELEFE